MEEKLENIQDMLREQHGIVLVQQDGLNQLIQDSSDLNFCLSIDSNYLSELMGYLKFSKAQLRQDLFVISELGPIKNGYFVEFGATDGISLSNTFLLEQHLGWNGILAEPAKVWHAQLKENRSAQIELDCVWNKTGEEIVFSEVENAEYSTIKGLGSDDMHAEIRKNEKSYTVNTISLNDLLSKYDAPAHMEYLSVDTEGSELEILSSFDFTKYSFSVITCEHNHTDDREKIFKLLTSYGYMRKYEDLSLFDDWYVRLK
jgi:FkbM family methyltransferase